MDEARIEALGRRAKADPDDHQASLEWVLARGRVEGPAVFLEVLKDSQDWARSSDSLQDLAIKELDRLFGEDLQHAFTKTYRCVDQSFRIATFHHTLSGIPFQLLPGGSFQMGLDGSTVDEEYAYCRRFYESYEQDWLSFEGPRHRVSIPPFLMAQTALCQEQWQAMGGTLSCHFTGPRLPVEELSWSDIQTSLEKLDKGPRLPSEAEWEYAYRAGSDTRFYWGSAFDGEFCWFDENSERRTHAVDEHLDACNAFGIVDMSGNISEMCADDWIEDYSSGPFDHLPRRSPDTDRKVMRGGDWLGTPDDMRASSRDWNEMSWPLHTVGYRLAYSLPSSAEGTA